MYNHKEYMKKWHKNHKEQQKCFNWKNLRPLWAKDNISKGAR